VPEKRLENLTVTTKSSISALITVIDYHRDPTFDTDLF